MLPYTGDEMKAVFTAANADKYDCVKLLMQENNQGMKDALQAAFASEPGQERSFLFIRVSRWFDASCVFRFVKPCAG